MPVAIRAARPAASRCAGVLCGLFEDLVRVQADLWNAVDDRLRADFDLPFNRFEPMRVMGRTEHCRVQDIASELEITVGGTSKLVDRIEAAGHCQRLSNPTDRRSSWIELTPEGHRVLDAATQAVEEELGRSIGALPVAVVKRLRGDLDHARRVLRSGASVAYGLA